MLGGGQRQPCQSLQQIDSDKVDPEWWCLQLVGQRGAHTPLR